MHTLARDPALPLKNEGLLQISTGTYIGIPFDGDSDGVQVYNDVVAGHGNTDTGQRCRDWDQTLRVTEHHGSILCRIT